MARLIVLSLLLAIVVAFGPGVLWALFSTPVGFVVLFLLLVRR
jgi:hypothetical protein